MTATEKANLNDFLVKAECLYCGKVLSQFENVAFTDDVLQKAGTDALKKDVSSASGSFQAGETFVSQERSGTADDLQNISAKIGSCTRCALSRHRTKTVPGIGVIQPLVLVIGEAPGADEDKLGEPFVGKAGQLLDKMLASIQLSRNTNCFIANIVKCRPQDNRDPLPEEAEACVSFLQAQIHLLKPKVILAVGRIVTQNLLKTSTGITKMHGQFYEYQGIPLMATFHPSALLRNESMKRPAWEDLKLLRTRLLGIDPEYQQKHTAAGQH